ncbi:MAG TPA: right-handed parallel beta-helix repeat-containing protein, partial [Phycisphaerae bacterium]|nr:right-handed parallel beta-helix repeat-containing protein [Phycisphaerae bacterium]
MASRASVRVFLVCSTTVLLIVSVGRGEDFGASAGVRANARDVPDSDWHSAGAAPRGGGAVRIVDCSGLGDYTTIQAAIDAAVDGDEIVILPNSCAFQNRWYEGFDFSGKAITVRSADPTDPAVVEATIIDGGSWGTSTVRIHNGESSVATLDGLTFVNAYVDFGNEGGAIDIRDASPTIRRCVFRDNFAQQGGAIRIQGVQPVAIEFCDFQANRAAALPGELGSAVYCSEWGNPRFTGCSFAGHTGVVVLANDLTSNPCDNGGACGAFVSCSFSGNSGVLIRMNRVTIEHCEFDDNDATCVWGTRPTIVDTGFSNNVTNRAYLVRAGDGLAVEGTQFDNNRAGTILYCENLRVSSADVTLRDCVFSNQSQSTLVSFRGQGVVERCDFVNNNGGTQTVFADPVGPLAIDDCGFRD